MRHYDFRWVEWNLEHATRHGVNVEECERLVSSERPRYIGDGKFRVVGRGTGGRWLQIIFAVHEDGKVFVLHARPLNDAEKHRERRIVR